MSSFPQPFLSTVSHWQATNRGRDSLWNHGRDSSLPRTADVVIIGGGITGCSLAYQLTRRGGAGEGKHVVLLEAKDIASGASGRNGGHISPASPSTFTTLVASLKDGGAGVDPEQALDILKNEADTLKYAAELAEKERITDKIDLWVGQKLEVKNTQAGVDAQKAAFDAYSRARAESSKYKDGTPDWTLIEDTQRAKQLSRMPGALTVSRGPAGSCHPHKFTTALARLALESTHSKFALFSWAPVSKVEHHEGFWTVDTGRRGAIKTERVVLCTNAHTAHLGPASELVASHITPFRGHAALITTPPTFSGTRSLKYSYNIENGSYLMTTPSSGIVQGVWNAAALYHKLCRRSKIWGVTDDSNVLPSFREFMEDSCRKGFEGWGKQAPGEGLMRAWSGIMASSRDTLPLIGAVPDSPGLFAAVAFHGHGMARILTATRGLAHQMKTGKWDEKLPTAFKITKERLQRAQAEAPQMLSLEDPEELNKLDELNDATEQKLKL